MLCLNNVLKINLNFMICVNTNLASRYSTARFKFKSNVRMHVKLLHITFIVMLPSSLLVLASFFQCMHYKCSVTTCNEQLAYKVHSSRANRLRTAYFKSIILVNYQRRASYPRAKHGLINLFSFTYSRVFQSSATHV